MNPVPASRLIGYALVVSLTAAFSGPVAGLRPVVVSLGAVLIAVALSDLLVSLWRVRPIRATVPGVVRLTQDRKGVVPLTLANDGGQARRVRLGVAWPGGVESSGADRRIDLLAGGVGNRVDLECTPRKRGRFTGLIAALEVDSWLGLWSLRTQQKLEGELRVYPNLFRERAALGALFLSRAQQGALARRTVGRGREFEKLRDYLPGDGFDEIHWKATAKRGRPITKIFQVERTQEIYVIVDTSRLSARAVEQGGVTQTALERCITATLVLLRTAEAMGDRFGLVAHDDRVRVFLRAGRGERHYGACREAVLGLSSSEATPDLADIVRHLRTHLRQRALLFFLTDLTDPVLAEDFARHIRLLARQHLVFLCQLRPPGVAPLFTGEPVRQEAEVYARLAGHARWTETRMLGQKLKPLGVTTALLENETMAAQLVSQYLQVKRRQAL